MKTEHELEELDILGIPVTVLKSYNHAVECVVEWVGRRRKTFCVAINPEKIYRAQADRELRTLIKTADFHICDGVGATIAARILYRRKVSRITGVQLFLDLMDAAEKDGLRVFLLGASPDSNKGACTKLLEEHPKLQIAGSQDGYAKDDLAVVKKINESRAEMLFVAMGSPRQEQWIAKYRERIEAPFCMGVGGTLDVLSGHAKWAPKLFRTLGMEFLYRLITEPKRWRRQFVLPKFALSVVKERVRRMPKPSLEPTLPFRPIEMPPAGDTLMEQGSQLVGSPDSNERRDAA